MSELLLTLLLVIEPSGESAEYYVAACDEYLRVAEQVAPDADAYCIAPSYAMRPRARPADLISARDQ